MMHRPAAMTGHGQRATVAAKGGPRLACAARGREAAMKKPPLYSRSRRPADPVESAPATAAATAPAAPARPTRRTRLVALLARHERKVWALALLVVAGALWYGN